MKKLVFVLMIALGVNVSSFAGTTNSNVEYSSLDHRNKSVVVVEQGIEFIIYKNGSFDYAPLYRNTNSGSSVNIRTSNGNTVNIATGGNRAQTRLDVVYDRSGRIARINNVVVAYDRSNKVARIGNADIDYRGANIYVRDNAYAYNDGRYIQGHNSNNFDRDFDRNGGPKKGGVRR